MKKVQAFLTKIDLLYQGPEAKNQPNIIIIHNLKSIDCGKVDTIYVIPFSKSPHIPIVVIAPVQLKKLLKIILNQWQLLGKVGSQSPQLLALNVKIVWQMSM